MKSILCGIIFCLFLNSLSTLNAQTNCAGITVVAEGPDPQLEPNSYWYAVNVTLDRIYDQDITVNGTISSGNSSYSFSVTVTAGNLNQTSGYMFQLSSDFPIVTTESISPSTVTNNGTFYSTQGFSGNCGSLANVLQTSDPTVLQSTNENEVAQYLVVKNQEIINFLSQKYPDRLPVNEIDVNDPFTTVFAVVHTLAELNNFEDLDESEPLQSPGEGFFVSSGLPDWLDCAIEIIGEYVDARLLY
ncbi:MAG TPA: hypothetical protein VM368_04015, partial [Flavisolibacter sp.]|nr:hypothetical protein [Flavisolibacter sp.]